MPKQSLCVSACLEIDIQNLLKLCRELNHISIIHHLSFEKYWSDLNKIDRNKTSLGWILQSHSDSSSIQQFNAISMNSTTLWQPLKLFIKNILNLVRENLFWKCKVLMEIFGLAFIGVPIYLSSVWCLLKWRHWDYILFVIHFIKKLFLNKS